ncbi:MAG: hypothetical protein R3B96_14275 [Pirellulaceae bacterium]
MDRRLGSPAPRLREHRSEREHAESQPRSAQPTAASQLVPQRVILFAPIYMRIANLAWVGGIASLLPFCEPKHNEFVRVWRSPNSRDQRLLLINIGGQSTLVVNQHWRLI